MFDRHEQVAELTDEQQARLRAVILSNDNDPLPVMGLGADRAATRLAGR